MNAIGLGLRFVAFDLPNTDPAIPARRISIPLALLEEAVCSREEESDRWIFGALVCSQEWDR